MGAGGIHRCCVILFALALKFFLRRFEDGNARGDCFPLEGQSILLCAHAHPSDLRAMPIRLRDWGMNLMGGALAVDNRVAAPTR